MKASSLGRRVSSLAHRQGEVAPVEDPAVEKDKREDRQAQAQQDPNGVIDVRVRDQNLTDKQPQCHGAVDLRQPSGLSQLQQRSVPLGRHRIKASQVRGNSRFDCFVDCLPRGSALWQCRRERLQLNQTILTKLRREKDIRRVEAPCQAWQQSQGHWNERQQQRQHESERYSETDGRGAAPRSTRKARVGCTAEHSIGAIQ